MKRIILFALLILSLTACAPVASQFVELPDGQRVAITGIFLSVTALLLDFAIGKLSWLEFFRQYQEAWATSAALAFIAWLENFLPTGTDDLSISFVGLLIAAGLYLLGRTVFRRKSVQGFS